MGTSAPFRSWPIALYFGSSFILHLIWENAQMPLFETGDATLWDNFLMCAFATATGDMLFMLTLYLTVAVICENLRWPSQRTAYSRPATWIVPVLVGVLLAVSFELWAVFVVRRWQYSSMPLIPIIHVGVTPVLQMICIPVTVTALCRWSEIRQSQIRATNFGE